MGVAGAICLEPFLCPGLRVPTAICKCREKAAELLASIPCSSQRQELDAVYKSELLVVVILLLSWGCWLWSVLPSSRLLTPACLSQAGRERSSQSPPAEAKSRISADFHGRAVYFWEQHLLLHSSARFPPRWGQGSRCSITGVAMGTDRDVTGVGRSGRDSDLIVPLQGRESSPKPQAGLLTKPCR